MFFLISSEVSSVEPLIRWVDGLTTDFVEIFIEFSAVRSFWSWLIRRQSEFRDFFAVSASLAPTPPKPINSIGSVN